MASFTNIANVLRALVVACALTLFAACQSPGPDNPAIIPTLPVTPMCTILCDVHSTSTISYNGQVFVSDRTDRNVDHGFTALRPMSGPLGNPSLTFTNPTGVPDTYGISEAWLFWLGVPEVHRAQATPELRTTAQGEDFFGSSWNITAQDQSGIWSGVFATGTANSGHEGDTPQTGALTVPQLMPVGLATPQMFACAGGRTEDNVARTTILIESTAPSTARGTSGGVKYIQDLLNGDRWFVPNAPGPLVGPKDPPTPPVLGPGALTPWPSVQCGMAQLDDDLTTRELHMLTLYNGVLYHAMASNFGPVTDGGGSTYSRFRTVSGWGDVGQALGGRFGIITGSAIVAHTRAISVFFVAQSPDDFRFRLFRAVRFSAGGGSWGPVKEVLALSGDAPTGLDHDFTVAAGTCPEFGAATLNASTAETLIVLMGARSKLDVIRVVAAPRFW
jgi:hypothetical protein